MTAGLIYADVSHADVLAALHGDSFKAPWSAQAFRDVLTQPTVTGWIAGGHNPTGFILVQTAADETEILTLAVIRPQRRSGIASQLVTHMLTAVEAAGGQLCHLEVAADNDAAIALYTHLGFAPSGLRAGYYSRPDGAVDAILMSKALNTTP